MEMIAGWFSGLGGWASGLLGGVVLVGVLGAAVKFVPGFVGKKMGALLGEAMEKVEDIKDPVERKLVEDIALAVVKWAEYKIPDKGQGRARFEAAAAKLCLMLPFLKGKDKLVADLIENAVAAMDAELKKASE